MKVTFEALIATPTDSIPIEFPTLAFLNTPTSDGRTLSSTIGTIQLPVLIVGDDGLGVGRLDSITIDGNRISGTGHLNPTGAEPVKVSDGGEYSARSEVEMEPVYDYDDEMWPVLMVDSVNPGSDRAGKMPTPEDPYTVRGWRLTGVGLTAKYPGVWAAMMPALIG
jgi:hypothetical protein